MMMSRMLTAAVLAAALTVPMGGGGAVADSHAPASEPDSWCVSGAYQDNPDGQELAAAFVSAVGDTATVCDDALEGLEGWDHDRVQTALDPGLVSRFCYTPADGDYYQRQIRSVVLSGPAMLRGETVDYPFYGPWEVSGKQRRAAVESCAGENPPRTLPKRPRADDVPGVAVYEYRIVFANDDYTGWAPGTCTAREAGYVPVWGQRDAVGNPLPDGAAVRYACGDRGRSDGEQRRNPEGHLAEGLAVRSDGTYSDGTGAPAKPVMAWLVQLTIGTVYEHRTR